MNRGGAFRGRAAAILLALSIVAVYAGTVRHPFIEFDDPEFVSENPHVTGGLSPHGVAWAFTTRHASNYWQPLAWLSHMLDCEIYGLRPGGHHATSVLIHLVSSIVLFLALARMTSAPGPSAFTAFLFALHPLHVESVAWISERKDVLSGLFFMLTLWGWSIYAARPSPARYAAVVVFFGLGLLSKPMLVTLPFVLLLLDYWPLGRWRPAGAPRRIILEKLPLLAMAAGVCGITLLMQPDGALTPFDALPLGTRLANAALAYGRYLLKTVWPAGLSVFYPYELPIPTTGIVVSCAALLIFSTIAFRERRRRPYLIVGWLWWLGMLIPVLGLFQVGSQSMADRYMYLPLVGLTMAVAWGARDLAASRPRAGRPLSAVALLVVVAAAALSWKQVGLWSSNERLFVHALDVAGENLVAEMALGNDHYKHGDWNEASRRYQSALLLRPDYLLARYNLGIARLQQGRSAESAELLSGVLRDDPAWPKARTNLCVALDRLGRPGDAATECAAALRADGSDVEALNAMAWIRATSTDPAQRDGTEAVRLAERACELGGSSNSAYLDTLAAAYAEQGRFAEAVGASRRAIALAGSASEARAREELAARLALYEKGKPYRLESGSP